MDKAYFGLKWGKVLTGDSNQVGLKPARIYVPTNDGQLMIIGRKQNDPVIYSVVVHPDQIRRDNGRYVGQQYGDEQLFNFAEELTPHQEGDQVSKFYELASRWAQQYQFRPMPVKADTLEALLP